MAKLVLDIEPEIIDGLLKSAAEKHVSVSEFVVDIFKKVDTAKISSENAILSQGIDSNNKQDYRQKKLTDYPEWIQKIVLSKEPTEDFNHKAEYGKHLEEKYGL